MPGVPESGGKMVYTQNCDLSQAHKASQLLHPLQAPPGSISKSNSTLIY